MKKHTLLHLCLALLLIMLPVCAFAGDSCTEGVHDLEMVDVKYPTCETDGYMVLECRNCNYSRTEITDTAWGHDWEDDGTIYADCENPGLKKERCANCGKQRQSVLSALGHYWTEGEIFQDATCEMSGLRYDVCEVCGKALERSIAPKGHTWRTTRVIKEATCTREGKVEAVCTMCGKEGTRTLKKTAHTCTEWTVTKKPTEKSPGSRYAVCEVCGKKVKEQFDYVPGDVVIYTTHSKVNLRTGPGKNNKQTGQVAKKGTRLGLLYEAETDRSGDVWYKVKYKDKFRWVSSDYAEARVEADFTAERPPLATGTELTDYFLRSTAPAAEALSLEEAAAQDAEPFGWASDALSIAGEPYVEQIVLQGEGFSLYGVRVGDKISSAVKALGKKNLVFEEETGDLYTYRVPALPDALAVDEDGFCGYLEILVGDDQRVQAIRLYADPAVD